MQQAASGAYLPRGVLSRGHCTTDIRMKNACTAHMISYVPFAQRLRQCDASPGATGLPGVWTRGEVGGGHLAVGPVELASCPRGGGVRGAATRAAGQPTGARVQCPSRGGPDGGVRRQRAARPRHLPHPGCAGAVPAERQSTPGPACDPQPLGGSGVRPRPGWGRSAAAASTGQAPQEGVW